MAKKKSRLSGNKKLSKKNSIQVSGAENKLLLDKYINQIVLFYQQGKLLEALKTSEQAIKKFPKQSMLLENAGTFAMLIGDSKTALLYYQSYLSLDPGNSDVFNKVGYILKTQGCYKEAEEAYKNALELRPDYVDALYNLGILLKQLERHEEAEEVYLSVLKYKPDHVETYINLGVVLEAEKRFAKAEECYQHALKLEPNRSEVFNNMGCLYLKQKLYKQAESFFQQALKVKSNYIDAYFNLGYCFQKQKNFEKAESCFSQVADIQPKHEKIYLALGDLYLEQEKYTEAGKIYRKALLTNNSEELYNNLGYIFEIEESYCEAEAYYLHALKLQPDYAKAFYNLGNLYVKTKSFEQAEKSFEKALNLNSDYIDARYNYSLLLLIQGYFEKAWQAYEFRYHPDKSTQIVWPPIINTPQWQGECLSNKTLLVWPEQGIGDEIMFSSCLNNFSYNNQGRIILACDSRLVKLLARSFPDILVIEKDMENRYQNLQKEIDFQCSIASLPVFFRPDLQSFYRISAYLKADLSLLSKWVDRYSLLTYDLNIGISWRGGADKNRQHQRSIALIEWLPILKYKANFINLQYGDHQAEIDDFSSKTGIELYDWDDANALTNLDDFAAQIKALDLVISIDNSTVHFSGALGVDTLVMLPFLQDWRWMDEQDDSYWYPNVMKLFKQNVNNDWSMVIENVSQILFETRS